MQGGSKPGMPLIWTCFFLILCPVFWVVDTLLRLLWIPFEVCSVHLSIHVLKLCLLTQASNSANLDDTVSKRRLKATAVSEHTFLDTNLV